MLFDYVQERYNIAKMPKHMYMKFSNIFTGKLNGMTKPIPAEHLYDMWRRKSQYLNKVYMNNLSKGKKMDGVAHLNYDLAVLTAKYDEYLKWIEKNKSEAQVNEQLKETVSVTPKLYQQASSNKPKEEELSDILDELI